MFSTAVSALSGDADLLPYSRCEREAKACPRVIQERAAGICTQYATLPPLAACGWDSPIQRMQNLSNAKGSEPKPGAPGTANEEGPLTWAQLPRAGLPVATVMPTLQCETSGREAQTHPSPSPISSCPSPHSVLQAICPTRAWPFAHCFRIRVIWEHVHQLH